MKKRLVFQEVKCSLTASRQFIQVLLGPRQVGKTTLVTRLIKELPVSCHYASADSATLQGTSWLYSEWQRARTLAKHSEAAILVLDEIQKIFKWSDIVKELWDEDTRLTINLKVLMLGSSPWLMQKGLSESLAGRFEIIPITHWSYSEMHASFGWDLEKYIYFGGYPGAVSLLDVNKCNRWMNYINDSIIETTISRDILLMTQVNKPALLRRLFQLSCVYSSQILSYQKMLGQLQEAGNTTTLAHYLQLLTGAGMVTGLQKYANQSIKRKSSSPKLQVFNTALMSAQVGKSFKQAKQDKKYWGRLVESTIGAYIINSIRGTQIKAYYWREGEKEVDFILCQAGQVIVIEVKSHAKPVDLSGLDAFYKMFKPERILIIGERGISIEKFLQTPIQDWFC